MRLAMTGGVLTVGFEPLRLVAGGVFMNGLLMDLAMAGGVIVLLAVSVAVGGVFVMVSSGGTNGLVNVSEDSGVQSNPP
jgi:hypothetical protein